MSFNSIDFALFLPIVFILYWFVANKRLEIQNLLIVLASYVFYGWWDWRFLSLIITSTLIDYTVGLLLSKEQNELKRKLLFYTSIVTNLGLLGVFKYYNFFIENLTEAFSFFGLTIHTRSLNIILPVGISFYTFQTLSYSIDVYKRKIKPTKDIVAFAAFVCYFPQLVAGPIERASKLLPQFHTERRFDYSKSVDGMRQMLWGFFKKIVIADNCAQFADFTFAHPFDCSGSTLVFGAIFFTIQIYADFSGYSDIAIGTSRLFGINLSQNFAYPYFSRSFTELWRRWHISLTMWFRDYLFIPLARLNKKKRLTWKIAIILLQFIVIGFWHGANWNYIIWGLVNALLIMPPLLLKKRNHSNLNTIANGRYFPSIKETLSMLMVFSLFVFSSIFFRSSSLKDAIHYFKGIYSFSSFTLPSFQDVEIGALKTTIITILFFFVEWMGRENQYAIEKIVLKTKKTQRWLIYGFIFFVIYYMGSFTDSSFVYFQF